jgi:hypothetical protein
LQQKIPLATKAQRHKEEKSKAFLLSALVTLWLKSFFVKKIFSSYFLSQAFCVCKTLRQQIKAMHLKKLPIIKTFDISHSPFNILH